MKTRQSRADLLQHLREQRGFLESSAAAFDAGEHSEAKRLASTIRTLVHDTKMSHSLLNQLGLKNSIGWVTTALPIRPDNLAAHPGLVLFEIAPEGARYSPPLDDLSPRRIRDLQPFGDWWTDPVTKASDGSEFSRKQLILGVTNTDGGSHVDPQLSKAYADLTRNDSLGWLSVVNGVASSFGSPVPSSVRQIAYEVMTTLAQIVESQLT